MAAKAMRAALLAFPAAFFGFDGAVGTTGFCRISKAISPITRSDTIE